jgi:hypothetical protein
MSFCLNKHEQCPKHTQPRTYPTRLLELGVHTCRLFLPQDHETRGPYAALSYCWGPNPNFLRLTSDNLQEFRSGILYTSLPIAFQEAILVIKKLGIRYLWIDALCIIQSGFGSGEDWRFECGRMQEVYSNCIINLSLAQAAHPNESCLGGYTLDSTLPFEVDIVYDADDHGSRKTHTCLVLPADYFQEALYSQPVGSRAWVMQERLLATRVLSIGHGELFWDCQQLPNASESLPYGLTLFPLGGFSKRYLGLSIPSIPQTADGQNLEAIWSELLEEYTARKLTYPGADKLVALSAISNRMGYAMDDVYLAGHFCKTLPQSLNWKIHRENLRTSQRLPKSSGQMIGGDWLLTPSWSWASMDGPITMWETQARIRTFVAVVELYDSFSVDQTEPEAPLRYKHMLTIRTWCHVIEWEEGEPDMNGALGMSFDMDDIHDLPENGSQCLLAALGGFADVVEGLLLREIDFNGKKVYERMGHFNWFLYGTADMKDGSWKTLFTDGERSIDLC